MKIEYICHSALLIETKDLKILTDPWLSGATYCNQWHLFPKPLNADVARQADVILISHGHEDHLHHDSLARLNKKAKVFYPFQWQQGIKEYLNSIGYTDVTEAITNKTYRLSATTSVTFIANALDSILVIEADGEVLVNINDALPANHKNIIKRFTNYIKAKWPKIDYLFCGYGSAAYFPNTVHCEGKNDLEVAEAREQLFGDNFCFIVDDLKPVTTIPFAADYVLLNDEKRWINRIKYSKEKIKEYYNSIYKGTPASFIIAHSGDVIEKHALTKTSVYHTLDMDRGLDQIINTMLADEIRQVNALIPIGEQEISSLEKAIYQNIRQRSSLFSKEKLNKVKYTIIVEDIPTNNCFHVDCSGNMVRLTRSGHVQADSVLTLTTDSKILNYCFASEWGGDAIIIGYGAEITILDKSIIEESLDIICVRLLTRQPVASQQMKAAPLRALKYLINNPITTSWAIKQVVKSNNQLNKNPVNERSVWLRKTKCEICQVCNIPMLSDTFGESLGGVQPDKAR